MDKVQREEQLETAYSMLQEVYIDLLYGHRDREARELATVVRLLDRFLQKA